VIAAEALEEQEFTSLAIGDSPMLVAVQYLAEAGFDVNAHGCRQYAEGLAVLEFYAGEGDLHDFVAIALGVNGTITITDLEQAVEILGEGRILGLVTQPELEGQDETDIETVRSFAELQTDRTVLIDWAAVSEGHENWFQPDGVHLTDKGAREFTALLEQGRDEAEQLAAATLEEVEESPVEEAIGAEPAAAEETAEDDGGGFPWTVVIVLLLIVATLAILRRRAVVKERIRERERRVRAGQAPRG
jgi:hypothetical protein